MFPIRTLVQCSQGKSISHYQVSVWFEVCRICMGISTQATDERPGIHPVQILQRCVDESGCHYEHIFIHMEDFVMSSHIAEQVVQAIGKNISSKKDNKKNLPYGTPDIYIGSQIRRHQELEDDADSFCSAIPGDHYVKNVFPNIQNKLMDHGRELNYKQQSPFISIYHPELNISPDLDQENTYYFQEMIGILCWAIELGQENFAFEV